MATKIRPELSENNKYRISKHRYYELKHFCLQYPIWKSVYATFDDGAIHSARIEKLPVSNIVGDPTSTKAIMKVCLKNKMKLIEEAAKDTDPYLYSYILKAVTEELSYNYLRLKLDIPCGRDMYYDRYRKFFWILSQKRD